MDKTQKVILRLTPGEKWTWESAAESCGLSLSAWMRDRLNRASKGFRGMPPPIREEPVVKAPVPVSAAGLLSIEDMIARGEVDARDVRVFEPNPVVARAGHDANAIREALGLKPPEPDEPIRTPRICTRCQRVGVVKGCGSCKLLEELG